MNILFPYDDISYFYLFIFLAAAVPKFGRIAIFRNLIPHSARPPAPTFLAARYTFPIKVSNYINFHFFLCPGYVSRVMTGNNMLCAIDLIYAFVFFNQVSETTALAKAKMLSEALDYKLDDTPEDPLYQALRHGDYQEAIKEENHEWVLKNIMKLREDQNKRKEFSKSKAENVLFPLKYRKVVTPKDEL